MPNFCPAQLRYPCFVPLTSRGAIVNPSTVDFPESVLIGRSKSVHLKTWDRTDPWQHARPTLLEHMALNPPQATSGEQRPMAGLTCSEMQMSTDYLG